MTNRPQNRCRNCRDTWYPRGSNVSLKCPNCGSGAVEVITIDPVILLGWLGVIGVGFLVFLIGGALGSPTGSRTRLLR